jgi:UDP-N-acetylenolpyruvoylglucosamine reductase
MRVVEAMTAETMAQPAQISALAQRDEPLSRHTTMKVGGPARWWAQPQSEAELATVLRAARRDRLALQTLGAGSNLIASDAGFEGVVLCLGSGFAWHRVEGHRLTAGGAMLLPKLSKLALQNRLGNLEWACGIPGSVGGSIWGNAGARGWNGEEKKFESRDAAADLESLVAFDRDGERHQLRCDEIEFAYRRSSLGELIVTAATFALKPLSEEETNAHREAVKELLKIRRETQPVNAASAGCVWKNPRVEGCAGAGQLIERLGLKELCVGGAQVSPIHANFIVNSGGATGDDVRALMRQTEARVLHESDIQLEREVRLLGD